MKKFRPTRQSGLAILGVLVALATVVATLGLTSSSAQARASFTVRAHHGTESDLDLGASGFSAGDQSLFVAPLTRSGHAYGRLVGSCTTVRAQATADQLCEFVLHMPQGQITASGTFRSGPAGPGSYSLPVLGGTGRYQRASGQINITSTRTASFPIQIVLS